MSIAPSTFRLDFDLVTYPLSGSFEIRATPEQGPEQIVTSGPIALAQQAWDQVMMAAFGF